MMVFKLTRARGRWVGLGVISFAIVLCTFLPVTRAADIITQTRACAISSPHPYASWADLSWEVVDGGITACRVQFSRLEVEDGYDFVYLNSSIGEASVTGGHPEGCWTDWVVGTAFTLRLTSNSYNTDYGFDAVTYEVQIVQAWESFLWVAVPISIVIVIAFVALYKMRVRAGSSWPIR